MSAQGRHVGQRHVARPLEKGPGVALATPNGPSAGDSSECESAEVALRRAELRYRLLFEQAPVMYVITGNEHGAPIITDCNELFLTTLGYDSRADVLGRPLGDFYAPPSRAELLEHGGFQRALEGRLVAEERQLVTRDGRLVETMLRAVPELDADGRTIGTRAMYVDITERKGAEQALRESEERFRLIAGTTSDVIWDSDLTTGRVWRSEGMQRLFGYGPGQEDPRMMWWSERIHPEDRERVVSGIYGAITGGGELWSGEYRFRRADGSYAYVHDRSYVIRDGDGRPVRLTGGITDLSERKRAEEELRESEERFRLIARATSDAIYDCDVATGRVWWGEGVRTLFGFQPGDAAQDTDWWRDQIHPDDRERVFAAAQAFMQGDGQTMVDEYRFRRADGSYAYVVDYNQFIRDEAGVAVRLIGGLRDITWRREAEEALRKKDSAIASSISAIALADLRGDLTYVNPAFLRMWGCSNENEALGKPASEFWQVRGKALEVGKALRDNGNWTGEMVAIRKDGSAFDAVMMASMVIDEVGEPICMMASVVDITERKRAEEELGYQGQLLASVNDAVMSTDEQFIVRSWNPAAERIYGWKADEVLGRLAWEVFRSEFVGWPKDEELRRQLVGGERGKAIRTLFENGRFHGELIQYRKDGAQVHIEARGIALRDSRGQITGYVSVNRDITDRRRAEAALRESERRYRLLAESATDIIWIRDVNLRTTYVNAAVTRIRGYSVEEVMAQSLAQVLTPASLKLARKAFAEELAQGAVQRDLSWRRTLELEATCKDGSTVWLDTSVTALRDENWRVAGVLGVSRDITDRKRAEEALQETREELENRVERRMRQGSAYGLTFRELTVLHLVTAGKSDKEIASTLGISALTASKHLGNILHKMGAASRTEAGVRAVRQGLLD